MKRTDNQTLVNIILLLIIGMVFLNCEGPMGPEGPVGPEGPQGPQGEQGEQGIPGEDGNANVIVKTISLEHSDYENGNIAYRFGSNGTLSRNAKVALVEDNDITLDIFENGLVLSYWKAPLSLIGTPSQWRSLPEKFLAFGSVYFINYVSGYQEGEIRFYHYFERNQDGTMPNIHDSQVPTLDYKYVIISGTVANTLKRSDIDLNDISKVGDFLNISLE
jgi:hypothetical protein